MPKDPLAAFAEFDEVMARSQAALITFLRTDLETAFLFLELARDATKSPERYRGLLANARQALQAIRYFSGQIQNDNIQRDIEARANELESALDGMKPERT